MKNSTAKPAKADTKTQRPTLAEIARDWGGDEAWLLDLKRMRAPVRDTAALTLWLKGYLACLKEESRKWRRERKGDAAKLRSVAIEAFASAFAPASGKPKKPARR